MLTVYSTHGSPGASTTAIHLAAHWASTGREVLLIEADPAGGSLSHNLGIQFTPGSASFLASGLPVLASHLIDHAQDVLFENLHVMPAPASPAGARGIFDAFAGCAGDLRTISENEMAVIIDGGRITADTAASALTTGAAGVVVVCRNNSQLSSLELVREALTADLDGDGPRGCAVTVGKSPIGDEEWLESYGLSFCGTIEMVADMAADLSAFLNRNKRKSKKWRQSLEQAAEALYGYAQPPVSDRSRQLGAAALAGSPGTGSAAGRDHGADRPAAGSLPTGAQGPEDGRQPPAAPAEPTPGLGSPMAPAAWTDSGQSHHPHYLPPTREHQPGHYLPPTPEHQPGHHLPPTPEHQPGHHLPPTPEHQPGHHLPPSAGSEGYAPYAPPVYEQAHPDYEQAHPDYEQAHQDYEQAHQDYEQAHPDYEQAPPVYEPAHQDYEQAHQDYEQAHQDYEQAHQDYEQAHQDYEQAPPVYEQAHPDYEQASPVASEQAHPGHPSAHYQPQDYQQAPYAPQDHDPAYREPQDHEPAQPPLSPPGHEQAHPGHERDHPAPDLPGPAPEMKPTGSFRDWAAKLHGLSTEEAAAQNRGG